MTLCVHIKKKAIHKSKVTCNMSPVKIKPSPKYRKYCRHFKNWWQAFKKDGRGLETKKIPGRPPKIILEFMETKTKEGQYIVQNIVRDLKNELGVDYRCAIVSTTHARPWNPCIQTCNPSRMFWSGSKT